MIIALLATAGSCYAGMSWIFPFSGTYLLFYAVTNSKLRLQNFGKKLDPSYGIYLYGYPIQQLLILHFKEHLTPFLLFAYALPVSALLGLISWKFVEAPALRLKKLTLAKKDVRPDSPGLTLS
jgi:peptidoglycan/LPS O-acetylase OafA/YrhL